MSAKVFEVENLSNEEYHNGEKYKNYWSSSNFKLYPKSPKHAEYEKFHAEKKESEAFRYGTILHDYMEHLLTSSRNDYSINRLLDNDDSEFLEKYTVFIPPSNKKTGKPYGATSQKYKDAIALVENPMSEKQYEAVKITAKELLSHEHNGEIIRHIIKHGSPEKSFFYEDEETGMKMKYRPDNFTYSKMFDYKSANDVSFDGIQKAIENYGYGFSAAMYQWIEHERTGVWKRFYWIFIENKAPYDSVIVDASPYAFTIEDDDMGGKISIPGIDALSFMAIKSIHIQCIEDNKFPGVSSMVQPNYQKQRILKLEPRVFYKNKTIDFYN